MHPRVCACAAVQPACFTREGSLPEGRRAEGSRVEATHAKPRLISPSSCQKPAADQIHGMQPHNCWVTSIARNLFDGAPNLNAPS